jgi:hydroxypyruvate reductase
VVTQHGYSLPTQKIEILEARHPVPDDAGERAARRMLDLVRDLHQDDLVIALISGGGSALLPLPQPGSTLKDKQELNKALLNSGASISEMNCIRRHVSAIKGGRLAAACHPARVVNLLMSDVPGDDPKDIASGPTVADPTTVADALEIIARYAIALPKSMHAVLDSKEAETVKPGDPRLERVVSHLIAAPQMALEAAAEKARAAGYAAYILSDAIEGEAREVARAMAAIATQVAAHGQPFSKPCVLLSGGETTVTVRGNGRGGRNVEFLLSLAIALRGHKHVHALAGDTDGIDGRELVAGAHCGPETLARARRAGLDPRAMLDNNDAHAFFEALDDQVVTGPTYTNVNDFRAILIE